MHRKLKSKQGLTAWNVEITRPVVHEIRKDGTRITHILPGGGKSRVMIDLLKTCLESNGEET